MITETYGSEDGTRRVVIESASWFSRPFRYRLLIVKRQGRRTTTRDQLVRTIAEAREFAKAFTKDVP